ncbi:MAG: lysine N(6)-hydroxylase/L-ornithine N(5)-oxygenase family protein [Halofilum sp. (in: g-proteobacteria)]
MTHPVHDFAAVGLGPFNLGLACLTEPIEDLDGVFLEQAPRFEWHPGLLIEGATLQTPFMADLVTLADPTSPYSFLNYAKRQGRLYSFYIREDFFLLRTEYNRYCQWAAEQVSGIEFSTRVDWIERDESRDCYRLHATDTRTGEARVYHARRLVLGTGTVPVVPPCCRGLDGPAIHASDYLGHRETLQGRDWITVVGSGQSAAEVFHDLLADRERHGYGLSWITRSERFFPLDYSRLTLELTSPEFIDYMHGLPHTRREELMREQRALYKGIDQDLIARIRDLLYTRSVDREPPVELRTNSALQRAFREPGGGYELQFEHVEEGVSFSHRTDALVLATGYSHRVPAFVEGIADRIRWDDAGRYDVARDYSIDHGGDEIFVQNAELHTHGFVAPDLGMGPYRNACIIRALTGVEHYPIEQRIAFQRFGAPEPEPEPVAQSPQPREEVC